MITAQELLTGLQIAVFVMLIVVLYHTLFIVVNVRKIVRRVDDVSTQIEDVIMKPISMADSILQWILDAIEDMQTKKEKKHHSKHE